MALFFIGFSKIEYGDDVFFDKVDNLVRQEFVAEFDGKLNCTDSVEVKRGDFVCELNDVFSEKQIEYRLKKINDLNIDLKAWNSLSEGMKTNSFESINLSDFVIKMVSATLLKNGVSVKNAQDVRYKLKKIYGSRDVNKNNLIIVELGLLAVNSIYQIEEDIINSEMGLNSIKTNPRYSKKYYSEHAGYLVRNGVNSVVKRGDLIAKINVLGGVSVFRGVVSENFVKENNLIFGSKVKTYSDDMVSICVATVDSLSRLNGIDKYVVEIISDCEMKSEKLKMTGTKKEENTVFSLIFGNYI